MFHKAGEIAAVSGLYFLAAQVGLLTGADRDVPMLIWPASGVAAAAVILLGNGGIVGVWLGAFLATLALYNGFLPMRTSVPVAAFFGIFAALQALLVVQLAIRWIGPFPKQPRLSHLLRFSALAAAGAAVGTTASLATILAAGVPLAAPVAIVWLSAWIGNTLGIVLFTPFLLVLHRWFHSESIEHQLAPMIFGLGIGFALLIFLLLWNQETEKIRLLFEGDAATMGTEFQEMLDNHMHALNSTKNLILTSNLVERDEFETFSRLHASDLDVPGLVGLAWAPRVSESDRAAFEAGLTAGDSQAAQITAWGAPGENAPASPGGVYAPISYLYPEVGNEVLLGLDLGTIPEAADAMVAASITGEPVMTDPFALSWLPDAPTGVMSILPIATTDRSTAETEGRQYRRNGSRGDVDPAQRSTRHDEQPHLDDQVHCPAKLWRPAADRLACQRRTDHAHHRVASLRLCGTPPTWGRPSAPVARKVPSAGRKHLRRHLAHGCRVVPVCLH